VVEVSVHESGKLTLAAHLSPGEPSHRLDRAEASLAEALETLESWLEEHGGERIAVTVRGPLAPLATWTTRSTNLALYWLATVLGDAWQPSFTMRAPEEPLAQASALDSGSSPAAREKVA
jgi:hypothetical protein